MTNTHLVNSIRAKKLAVLIRAARQKAGKTREECAQALGILLPDYEAYELGEKSPSLPETEILAYYLDVPLEHFYGGDVAIDEVKTNHKYNPDQLIRIRQRMIGVLLKKARMEADLSIESVAEKAFLSPELLEKYEYGERPVPLPHLEALGNALGRPVKEFQDRNGPVGQWISQQKAVREFLEMPPELQVFISLPINRPYIELAQRLSEMSVDKLRAVAEGLLEITL